MEKAVRPDYAGASRYHDIVTKRSRGFSTPSVIALRVDAAAMSEETENPIDPEELPSTAGEFAAEYPDVWDRYADLGEACAASGPIDGEAKRLVKLALAVAAQSEGAVHSHVRRARDEGVQPETLRHVAVLSIPTIGFPQAMAALSWIDDPVDEGADTGSGPRE